MQAVRIHAYGGPDVLVYEEAPQPRPAQDEVLIRVQAAGVNPLDWKMREGGNLPLPLILGWEFAGTVAELGPGVSTLAVGDAVFGSCQSGGYAEYLTVPVDLVAPRPRSLDTAQAAAVPVAALTAWQSLFTAINLAAGQRVLIHAAAGGVGTYAVQLARWRGAYVIGTASARNHAFLRTLGADETIDYTATAFETAVRDVDVVFDIIGGETQQRSWGVLRRGGTLISVFDIDLSPEDIAARGVHGASLDLRWNGADLMEISRLIDGGQVRPVVQAVLPLSEARRAHDLSQERHVRGKLVLHVADGDHPDPGQAPATQPSR